MANTHRRAETGVEDPDPYQLLEFLSATVDKLGVLWAIISLADESPGLTNEQLQARLTALAQACARHVSPSSLVHHHPGVLRR